MLKYIKSIGLFVTIMAVLILCNINAYSQVAVTEGPTKVGKTIIWKFLLPDTITGTTWTKALDISSQRAVTLQVLQLAADDSVSSASADLTGSASGWLEVKSGPLTTVAYDRWWAPSPSYIGGSTSVITAAGSYSYDLYGSTLLRWYSLVNSTSVAIVISAKED